MRQKQERISTGTPLVRLIELLEADAQDRWLVTLALNGESIPNGTVASFGSDNWCHFRQFANKVSQDPALSGGIIVRKFENLVDVDSNLPLKSVCGILLSGGELVPLTGATTMKAASFDCDTEAPLELEPMVRYLNATDMLPDLFR